MVRYLAAAEVDQIQEWLFRSSRLREVIGGSHMLSYFCTEIAPALITARYPNNAVELVIADGGAFRIVGNDPAALDRLMADLAESYRRWTGGRISWTEPVPIPDEPRCFAETGAKVTRLLWQAKRAGEPPTSPVQLPYTAICTSCGQDVAVAFQSVHGEPAQYLCGACIAKRHHTTRERASFLDSFRDAVRKAVQETGGPEPRLDSPQDGRWPEAVGKLDPTGRQYIAYLVADGNDMGVWFSRCNSPEQMTQLSRGLSEALRASLAEPTAILLAQLAQRGEQGLLPIVPLILGGDDLFALLPAPWAVDCAARFCRAYERRMAELLRKLDLTREEEAAPTITAAVVVCKATYPFRLAHRAGELLLRRTKRLRRREAVNGRNSFSAVDFLVVTGSAQVTEADLAPSGEYRPTIKPYPVSPHYPDEFGLPLDALIQARVRLGTVPARRLEQLRELYARSLPTTRCEEAQWKHRLESLLKRFDEDSKTAVTAALGVLGSVKEPGYLRQCVRGTEPAYMAHGMPDLIEAWDYACPLENNPAGGTPA